jgi:class 3 adenylate cyclase
VPLTSWPAPRTSAWTCGPVFIPARSSYIHTGEVELRGTDIAGLAVAIAKRLCDLAGPGQVLVSETVRSGMAGTGIDFKDQGHYDLKGVPRSWRLFSVEG